MFWRSRILLILFLYVIFIYPAFNQNYNIVKVENSYINTSGIFLNSPGIYDKISQEQIDYIKSKIKSNINNLTKIKGYNSNYNTSHHVKLEWPLKSRDGFDDYGYYYLAMYVDHNDTFPNKIAV